MVNVTIIETSGLGDRSYLISDGEVAVSVDPQRDIDRVLELTGGLRITHVLETHIHSDYVTGGLALAKEPAPNTSFPQGKTSTLTAERLRMATGSTPTKFI